MFVLSRNVLTNKSLAIATALPLKVQDFYIVIRKSIHSSVYISIVNPVCFCPNNLCYMDHIISSTTIMFTYISMAAVVMRLYFLRAYFYTVRSRPYICSSPRSFTLRSVVIY